MTPPDIAAATKAERALAEEHVSMAREVAEGKARIAEVEFQGRVQVRKVKP